MDKVIPTCLIRIIINPVCINRYSITGFENDITVVIQAKSATDLNTVVETLKSNIIVKRRYKIIFNFKSGIAAKQNSAFKSEMIKMFQIKANAFSGKNCDSEIIAETVATHMRNYNHYPDMKVRSQKNMLKIINYMESVTNTKIDPDVIPDILDIINVKFL